jgi:DNA invertase Pin-like site-specific DNA recombinase
MGQEIFGYIRVSSKDQNVARQLESMLKLGISAENIHTDLESGKDFNRKDYIRLKQRLREGDILYIKSIDRFGRNYKEIRKEWAELTQKEIEIKVIDMPLLDTTLHKDILGNLISDIVLEVLAYVADKERSDIKTSQREGIKAAKDNHVVFGRPKIPLPKEFEVVYKKWKAGEIKAVKAMAELKLKKSMFYIMVKKYEKGDSQ